MSAQVQIADSFRRLPSYSITPMESVAIALKMGDLRWEKARLAAMSRRLGEFAVVGDCTISVEASPADDMRPPDGWLREFCPKKALDKAERLVLG